MLIANGAKIKWSNKSMCRKHNLKKRNENEHRMNDGRRKNRTKIDEC